MSEQTIVLLSPVALNKLFNSLERIESLLSEKVSVQSKSSEELLTIQEASCVLHLSVPTIYGLVHKRELPSFKKGKRLYFSKDELITWIKTGRKKTIVELTTEAEKEFVISNRKK